MPSRLAPILAAVLVTSVAYSDVALAQSACELEKPSAEARVAHAPPERSGDASWLAEAWGAADASWLPQDRLGALARPAEEDRPRDCPLGAMDPECQVRSPDIPGGSAAPGFDRLLVASSLTVTALPRCNVVALRGLIENDARLHPGFARDIERPPELDS